MAPKQATKTEGISDSDLQFLDVIFGSLSEKPTFDWEAIRATAGLSTTKTTREKFRLLSVKRGWFQGNKAATTSSPGASPCKTATGRVTKRSPSKTTPKKATKGNKKNHVSEEEDDEDDEEASA